MWSLSSDKFLRDAAYLEFRREWQAKLGRDQQRANGADGGASKDAEADGLAKNADAFVLAQLADPEISEAKKEQLRDRWRKEHADQAVPWEVS